MEDLGGAVKILEPISTATTLIIVPENLPAKTSDNSALDAAVNAAGGG